MSTAHKKRFHTAQQVAFLSGMLRSSGNRLGAQVIEFVLLGFMVRLNVTQSLPTSALRQGHTKTDPSCWLTAIFGQVMPFGLRLEFMSRQRLEQLMKGRVMI